MGLPSTILQDLPSDCRFIFPEETREGDREREREQISHAMGYIFIILREITLKTERKMEILGRQIKDTRSLKRDNWVENKGKKRLKAKMKRNTAEIR